MSAKWPDDMSDSYLLPDLIRSAAACASAAPALIHGEVSLNYGELDAAVQAFAGGLAALGLQRGERVAIYLDNVKDVIDDGYQTAEDVCKDLEDECTAAGIS